MHSLHADRAVPHALESALLLRGAGAGFGALEAPTLTTRPAERRRGIAEGRASVVEEAESHTRRHDGGGESDVVERRSLGQEGRKRPVIGGEFSEDEQ